MGFGFNLGMIFIILPLTLIGLLLFLIFKTKVFIKIVGIVWSVIMALVLLSYISRPFFEKKILDKEDYHGNYVIDRSYFSGVQSDWQYEHFRFEITKDDSIFFYVTEKKQILKTYKGVIKTVAPHSSHRLIIQMEEPTHHVLSYNPTTYRFPWSFILVFNSPKYYNMYFTKGKWKALD